MTNSSNFTQDTHDYAYFDRHNHNSDGKKINVIDINWITLLINENMFDQRLRSHEPFY